MSHPTEHDQPYQRADPLPIRLRAVLVVSILGAVTLTGAAALYACGGGAARDGWARMEDAVNWISGRRHGCGSGRVQESGKKMNQIFTAMMAYSNDFNAWPLAGQALIRPGMSAADAAKVTALTCEMLAATMDLPPKLFKAPTAPYDGPPAARPVHGTDWSGASPGGWEVAGPVQPGVSYALDWQAPGDAATKSTRVWLAERSPDGWGGRGVMVVYGDGHTSFLKAAPGAPVGMATWGSNPSLVVCNPDSQDALPDNIYDSHGDLPEADLRAGHGSATRSWVK